jgi:hypothetical protein
MTRSVKLLTPLASLVVLLASSEYAGHYRGPARFHYGLAAEPRFGWLVAFLILIWSTTYLTGVTETGIRAGARLVRSASAVVGAVVVISLAELVMEEAIQPRADRHFYLPAFDIAMCMIVLVPLLTLVASLTDRTLERQGQQERVMALVDEAEKERLVRDLTRNPERPVQLVLAISPAEALPSPERPTVLEDLIEEHKATLLIMSREAQSLDGIVTQAVTLHSKGVRIRTLSLFYDEWLGKLPILRA